jgi:hypothetical protein
MMVIANGDFYSRTWSVDLDLFGIQMYDYILTGDNLKHAAKGDWAITPPNIYT